MDRLARGGTIVGGVMIFAAAVIVTIEILSRNILGISLGGADEISSYLFAVAVAWALPNVMLSDSNVRIEALVNLLAPRARDLVFRAGTLVLLLFLGVLAFRATEMAWTSFQTNAHAVTPLQTPLAIPQSLWALGLCLAVLAGILQVFRRTSKRLEEKANDGNL
ncbi:MAG: TRAP transporter small permease [Pseudomonadota bacterium]